MPPTPTHRLTGDRRQQARQEAARLYTQGSPITAVARQIGGSYGLTRTLLLEAGIRLRKPGIPRGARIGETRP